MNTLEIVSFTKDKTKIDVKDRERGIELIFSGNIESLIAPLVKTWLETLHQRCVQKHIKTVWVDFTRLHLLTSLGLRNLANWILKVKTSPFENKYQIIFEYSTQHSWQEITITNLEELAPELVSKKVKA